MGSSSSSSSCTANNELSSPICPSPAAAMARARGRLSERCASSSLTTSRSTGVATTPPCGESQIETKPRLTASMTAERYAGLIAATATTASAAMAAPTPNRPVSGSRSLPMTRITPATIVPSWAGTAVIRAITGPRRALLRTLKTAV